METAARFSRLDSDQAGAAGPGLRTASWAIASATRAFWGWSGISLLICISPKRCGCRREYLFRANGPFLPAPRRNVVIFIGSTTSLGTTMQSFEPEDFPEMAEKPAICGLLRRRFRLRRDRFWPECDFGRSVSGPRNIVSPMQ